MLLLELVDDSDELELVECVSQLQLFYRRSRVLVGLVTLLNLLVQLCFALQLLLVSLTFSQFKISFTSFSSIFLDLNNLFSQILPIQRQLLLQLLDHSLLLEDFFFA